MTIRSWIRKLFESRTPRTIRQAPARWRPSVEALEDRLVPTTFTVSRLADDALAGSLRWAITQANTMAGDDIINFSVTGTINLAGALPTLDSNLAIQGPGAGSLTVRRDTGGDYRIFSVPDGTVTLSGLTIANGRGGILNQGTLTVSNCTLLGNSTSDVGGGILTQGTLTVSNSILSGNSAGRDGGGIFNWGTLTVSNSNLSGNSSGNAGGGIHNFHYCTLTVSNSTFLGNSAEVGGGIFNNAEATLTVSNSTLAGNSASRDGGGIYIGTFSSATVSNSTLSGNSANRDGGGIYDAWTLTVNNSTLSGNSARAGGGGGIRVLYSSLTLNNTLVVNSPTGGNIAGSYTGSNNLFGGQPLGLLQNNGGPTWTHALPAGSPAINAGNNALIPAGVTTDQRGPGFARISGGTVDIGAFEVQPPRITSLTVPATGAEGSPVALSATATTDNASPLTYTWTIARSNGTTLQTLNGASSSFTPPDNGSYGVSLTVTDGDGGSATGSATVNVANRVPTPTLLRTNGYSFALATQVLTFRIITSDPSSVDTAAGFQYSINWGDGSPTQSVTRTVGIVNLTHVYANAGDYTATYTATDKDGGVSVTRTFVTTAWPVTSDYMQAVIDEQGSITMRATTDAQAQSVITAVNGLSAQFAPATITLNLGSGTYTGTTASPKANIALVIIGSGSSTTIVGSSPSLNVTEGTVILTDVALVNSTNAPTVQVSGGSLTLRNVVIEESTTADQAALLVTGGTVDLGRPDDPGGNRFNTNGRGKLIRHTGAGAVSAVGNTFQTEGTTLTSPYRIEDGIDHAVDTGAGGVVTFVPGNLFITVNGGSLQRGIDAIASEGTVNVEAASNQNYHVGSKLLTVRFENGPTLTQQRNPEDPGLRDLVVTGTAAADNIQLTPAGGAVQAQVRGVPNGRFAPNGRLVVHGGAGNDFISVAGGIALPAWLYGEAGNDALHGGGGANVLLGGTGDDQLNGGSGRDLLIGGLGADLLNGNGGDDLLLAGTTAFDGIQAALAAVMAEWTSARSYADRAANLSGAGSGLRANGGVFLVASGPDATVFDDESVDVLAGASGRDRFFANLSGGLARDLINGLDRDELVEELGVLAP